MKFSLNETVVLEKKIENCSLKIGERLEIIDVLPSENKYVVEDKHYNRYTVEETNVRAYDACDEYEDMYCDTCGGTACMC